MYIRSQSQKTMRLIIQLLLSNDSSFHFLLRDIGTHYTLNY